MHSKRFFLFLLILVLIGIVVGGYFLLLRFGTLDSREDSARENSQKQFLYEDFVRSSPVFVKEQELSQTEQYREVAAEMESATESITEPQDRAYARYLIVRAYVNAVRKDNADTESLSKALIFSREILTGTPYPNLKAFTVDIMDRLLYEHIKQEVKDAVMSDNFFKRFGEGTQGNVTAFRKNLLTYGDNQYRMTNIKMKLALLHARELSAFKKNMGPDDTARMEAMKQNIRSEMAKAEISLQEDKRGNGPFRSLSYLPEPLYNKALVADHYYRTTGEAPFGEVDRLYQEALDSANLHFQPMKPAIELARQDHQNFLGKKASLP